MVSNKAQFDSEWRLHESTNMSLELASAGDPGPGDCQFCYTCGQVLMDWKYCPKCGPRWLTIANRPCADMLVTHKNLCLLIERADTGLWATPGGHVDAKEHPFAAAVRELHEETGLALPLDSSRFVGVYLDDKGHYVHQVMLYTLEAASYNLELKLSAECRQYAWFDHNVLPANILGFVPKAVTDTWRSKPPM